MLTRPILVTQPWRGDVPLRHELDEVRQLIAVVGWCAFGMLVVLAMVAVLFAAGCEVRWPSSFYQREQEEPE
jgi:hypothetical protein